MRTRLLVQLLSLAVIVAVGAVWLKARATAVDLQARLAARATFRRATFQALVQERDRLQDALAAARRRRSEAMPVATAPVLLRPPAAAPSLVLGAWRPAREWRNEGQGTPRDTVTTLLWAAAGGDLAALTPLIAYDEAGRKQARAFFDSLPPAGRQAFATPEALVAGLTIQAVPDGAAQLSWLHQRDPDHATVGLLLRAPEPATSAEVRIQPAQGGIPPMLDNPVAARLSVLSLQRTDQGWHVVIPAAAIERLARQYRASAPAGAN